MLGSMGLASSIGLGLAMSSNRKVVVFDGDGSVLMILEVWLRFFNQNPENIDDRFRDNNTTDLQDLNVPMPQPLT